MQRNSGEAASLIYAQIKAGLIFVPLMSKKVELLFCIKLSIRLFKFILKFTNFNMNVRTKWMLDNYEYKNLLV